MKLIYPAVFTPFGDREGYTVEFPDLPGCVTEGDSLIEAIEMGIDAACGWILGEIEEGNGFPAPRSAKDIELVDADDFVNMIILDIDAYAEQYGNKAIRRNVTLPAWLDTYVQKNNLSLSKVLQDSVMILAQKEHRL